MQIKRKPSIFFRPLPYESSECWLYRLAHNNCLHVAHLFGRNVGAKFSQLSCLEILGNEDGSLISEEEWKKGHGYPELISSLANYSGHFLTDNAYDVCPYCLANQSTPYQKRDWQHPWNTHCDIHGVPLTPKCIHCNRFSPLFGGPSYSATAWKVPWGYCAHCSKPLAAVDYPPPTAHRTSLERTIPRVQKTNELVRLAHEGQGDPDLLYMLIYLAELLKYDLSHKKKHTYSVLHRHGIDPMTYVCCDIPRLNKAYGIVESVPPDAAINIAWEIVEKHSDVICELRDEGWISDLALEGLLPATTRRSMD